MSSWTLDVWWSNDRQIRQEHDDRESARKVVLSLTCVAACRAVVLRDPDRDVAGHWDRYSNIVHGLSATAIKDDEDAATLELKDEPRNPGAVVIVHYGDYRRTCYPRRQRRGYDQLRRRSNAYDCRAADHHLSGREGRCGHRVPSAGVAVPAGDTFVPHGDRCTLGGDPAPAIGAFGASGGDAVAVDGVGCGEASKLFAGRHM